MKRFAISIFFLAMSSLVFAQEPKCDCTITPFKPSPPCLSHCCAKVLATSTREELELILGLQREEADRIVNWEGRERAKTLKDFEKILSPKEIRSLSGKINSLNESQLEYFSVSADERAKVSEPIKAIFASAAATKTVDSSSTPVMKSKPGRRARP